MPINSRLTAKLINQLKTRQLIKTHLTQNLNQALVQAVNEIIAKGLNNHEFNDSPTMSKRLTIIANHGDKLIHNNVEYLKQWQDLLNHPRQWDFKDIDPLIYHRGFNQQLMNQLISSYEVKIIQQPNADWLLDKNLIIIPLAKYNYASKLLTQTLINVLSQTNSNGGDINGN